MGCWWTFRSNNVAAHSRNYQAERLKMKTEEERLTENQIQTYCESFCLYSGFKVAVKELYYLANGQETTQNLYKRIKGFCERNEVTK
jgi:phage host-nuclease inhibitor protein Gam